MTIRCKDALLCVPSSIQPPLCFQKNALDQKKKNNAYKPGFVFRLRETSIIYLCDLPSGAGRAILQCQGKKIKP